jgi:conjugal transfer pilus assembly protein TraW
MTRFLARLSPCFSGVLAVAVTFNVQAGDLLGPGYEISEPNMLDEIHARLEAKQKSGEIAALQQEAMARTLRSVEEPRQVAGLSRTPKGAARTFYLDPTYTVPETIVGPNGTIIAPAGFKINPLDFINLSKHLLFFDGRDASQVKKAESLVSFYHGRVKLILTAGRPLELSRRWKTPVYFDQGGAYVRRFNIAQVPALVAQEGKRLRVDELEVAN